VKFLYNLRTAETAPQRGRLTANYFETFSNPLCALSPNPSDNYLCLLRFIHNSMTRYGSRLSYKILNLWYN